MKTTKPVTKENILSSMYNESLWDTLLEDFCMPEEIYEKIKNAQYEWQDWLDSQKVELKISDEELKDNKHY